MGVWIRVDANRHTHQMGRRIGAWGCIVIEAVWEIAKVHGRQGVIGKDTVHSEAVSEWLRLDREAGDVDWAGFVAEGLRRCYEHGAIIDQGDGTVRVRDWSQRQLDPGAAERQRRSRVRRKQDPCHRDTTDVTVTDRDVTMSRRQDGTIQDGTEETRAPDYSNTHPAIDPDRIDAKPDLSWIVQESFRGQYAEMYGHKSRWNEPGHGQKAADLVSYFRELAEAKGIALDADTLARGVKNATKRYLADNDEFVTAGAHNFDLFVSRIDRYVGRQT